MRLFQKILTACLGVMALGRVFLFFKKGQGNMRKTIWVLLALSVMAFQCEVLWAADVPVALDLYLKDPQAITMVVTLKAVQSRFDKVAYKIVSTPSQGTLNAVKPNSPTDAHYIYTPDKGFTGEVTFTYIAKNAYGQSAPATVTIKVGTKKVSTGRAAVVHKKQAHHQIYFVSTTGKSTGNGSMKKPWDLQTALSQPSSVNPGDTIMIENGTYKGSYTSNLNGTPSSPITVTTPAHGHVFIKSESKLGMVALEIAGTWTTYKNIVIDQAAPQSLVQGPAGNKFIQVVVRDSAFFSGPMTIRDQVVTTSTANGANTTLLGDYST